MYNISEIIDYRASRNVLASVDSLEAAEAFFADKYDVICFDRDDENDAADVMVQPKGNRHAMLIQFTVEAA